MPNAFLDFSDIDVGVRMDMQVDLVQYLIDPTLPVSEQRYAGFQVEPYMVFDGVPQAQPQYGVYAPTTAGTGEVGTFTTIPAPESFQTGADGRWLPAFGRGAGFWSPYQFTQGVGNWSWDWHTPAPTYDPTYEYDGAGGVQYTRPAFTFDANTYGRGSDPNTVQNGTIAMVVVLGPGEGKQYALFASDREATGGSDDSGNPFALAYAQGRFDVRAGGRVTSYESDANPNRPMIVVLSLDTVADIGRLVILDSRRKSTEINLAGFTSLDFRLFIGAYMHTFAQFNAGVAANMDLLEIDYWARALSFVEIDDFINKVAPAYGLAG